MSPHWTPGDPCPSCGGGPVKFNGGNPLCLACGEYMPGPPRPPAVSASRRESASDGTPPSPFGVSDCDNCGANEVPIAHANDEGFEWCADCWTARAGKRGTS